MFRLRSSFRTANISMRSSQTPMTFQFSSNSIRYLSSAVQTADSMDNTPEKEKELDIPLSSALKPREVVARLDAHIIGQEKAKKAVAVALRNRWRRHQLSDEMRKEVMPKNILMIGPTGCGKTEIARRMAKLCQAPFVKVEATKYTEVGFHGKDVDTMIKDLVDVSMVMTKQRLTEKIKEKVAQLIEDRILTALTGAHGDETQLRTFRTMLREGVMENTEITIEVPSSKSDKNNNSSNSINNGQSFGVDDMARVLQNITSGGKTTMVSKRMTISEAREILQAYETELQLEHTYDLKQEAIAAAQENGIVFIDEIDKVISGPHYLSADASAEGVQRDLLPLIEGSVVSTKHGDVDTSYILFIASGAFHSAKPSELMAELQGRLPIRVTLDALTENDLFRVLTEPVTSLLAQQIELMKSENVTLQFTEEATREIAKVAFEANISIENIGARRLHSVLERVVEDISFNASDRSGETIVVDANLVREKVKDILTATDLRKYIL